MFVVTPACVTVTVRVIPPPMTVTVALREVAAVLAVQVAVIVPLLLPDVGDKVSQVASSVAVQLTLLVMPMPWLPAGAV